MTQRQRVREGQVLADSVEKLGSGSALKPVVRTSNAGQVLEKSECTHPYPSGRSWIPHFCTVRQQPIACRVRTALRATRVLSVYGTLGDSPLLARDSTRRLVEANAHRNRDDIQAHRVIATSHYRYQRLQATVKTG